MLASVSLRNEFNLILLAYEASKMLSAQDIKNIETFKNEIDNIVKIVFNVIMKSANVTQKTKLRKASIYVLLLKIKQSTCKDAKIIDRNI